MRLIRLKADFGGLKERELTLNPGLNVIEAPNGSGKSSWCRLIRAMLYGISSAERSRGGSLPDKLRYVPWDGSRMSGQMDIEWRGKPLTLTRRAEAPGKPFGDCIVTLTGTAERMPALEGGSVGEALLGFGESVFLRSACISGGSMAVEADDELERRILALVGTGGEESTAGEAKERLMKQKRQLSRRSGGEIAELQNRLRQLQTELRDMEAAQKEVERQRSAVRQKERELAEWKTELLRHERDALSARSEEYQAALAYYESRKRELEALRLPQISRQAQAALREARLALEDAERRQREELLRLGRRTPKQRILPALSALLFLLSLLLLPKLRFSVPLLLGSAIAAMFFVLRLFRRKTEAAERLRRCDDEVRERANALRELRQSIGDVGDDAADAYALEDALSRRTQAERECEAAKRNAELLGRQQREIPMVEGVCSTARSEAENGVRATEAELRLLEKQLAQSEGRMALFGDPLLLSTEELRLKAELARKEREFEALDMALETLTDSEQQFQTRVSPLLSRRTGALLNRLSGGAYAEVLFDGALKLLIETDGERYRTEYFSEGTKNLVYLAVRLAICELILPPEEPCPLILDDVLWSFDEYRAKEALRLIREYAKQRQVILFTCRHRESELLSELEEEDYAVCHDSPSHGEARSAVG